jgi:putative FmdB family regulatory protein
MRTYEFRCRTCGRHFEVPDIDSETDQVPKCPYCHSLDAELRLSSIFAPKQKNSSEVSMASTDNCGSPGPFS